MVVFVRLVNPTTSICPSKRYPLQEEEEEEEVKLLDEMAMQSLLSTAPYSGGMTKVEVSSEDVE